MWGNFILFWITSNHPTHFAKLSMCFQKTHYREENASSIVIEIVRFVRSLYVTLVDYLWFINETPIIQKPSTMYCLLQYTLNNANCFKLSFFEFARKNITENVLKMCFIVDFEIPERHSHFFMSTIELFMPKSICIYIKIATLAMLEHMLWPNMWFQ